MDRWLGRTARLVAAGAVLAGCGAGGGGRVDAGPDPADAELVVCASDGPAFPRSALDELHEASPPDDELAEGMQAFLGSEEGAFWPQEGWRVLSDSGTTAVLLASADSQLWFQTLELDAGGDWRWSGSSVAGECPLHVPAPAGHNAVVWRLDPGGESPTPSSTSVDVLVHETACASGEPVGDRLVGPDIDVTTAEVRVGFLAEVQAGDHSCPSNPETPITIHLDEPLGNRELVDAYDLRRDLRDYL
jgi:hypothetical protein